MKLRQLTTECEVETFDDMTIEQFEEGCQLDKTTRYFIKTMFTEKENRNSSSTHELFVFAKNLIMLFMTELLIILSATMVRWDWLKNILGTCCVITIMVFNLTCIVAFMSKYINDYKSINKFNNTNLLRKTQGSVIGVIKSDLHIKTPIVKFKIGDKTFIGEPDLNTKNKYNEIGSNPTIYYLEDNPYEFFIQGSNSCEYILNFELVVCILYFIISAIILIV